MTRQSVERLLECDRRQTDRPRYGEMRRNRRNGLHCKSDFFFFKKARKIGTLLMPFCILLSQYIWSALITNQ